MDALTAGSMLDLALRGGAAVLLALVAALLMRDHGRVRAARLGALFALGGAAHALWSAPAVRAWLGDWRVALMAVSTANNLVFWMFARALFEDDFRPAAWMGALWAAIAGAVVACGLWLQPTHSPLAWPVDAGLNLTALAFAVLAVAQTVSSWRADLVEPRRRARVGLVAAAAGYIAVTAIDNLLRRSAPAWPALHVAEAAGLAAITLGVAWAFLGVAGGEALFAAVAPAVPAGPAGLTPAEQGLASALGHAMDFDRAYRQDGLTIGALAHRLGTPEYRLRRVINRGLGHRNFNSFLNRYRIADAKAALADPDQAAVPILTIALDAGFNSLGPFNRAFRAETGVAPSEFRRASIGVGGGDERVISISAGRIRKSA
jgi:AraC-like DNA-binding protein